MLLKCCFCAVILSFYSVISKDLPRSKRSDDLIHCQEGWYSFREKCFKFSGTKRTDRVPWFKAKILCADVKGTLATIHSKEEQDFIVTFLLMELRCNAWIGLSDRRIESHFEWDDGSEVNFTNWRTGEPTGFHKKDKEDCVEMEFKPSDKNIGLWNDRNCTIVESPYICQTPINYMLANHNPKYCSYAEGGGWKFQDSCYHLISESRTWDMAEQYCQDKLKGHLATINDITVDLYLDNMLSILNKGLWIGIKLKNDFQQQWSSGWYVAYSRIDTNQNFINGTCVLRRSQEIFVNTPCFEKHSFICEASKVHPPILKLSTSYSHCPEFPSNWRDLGGKFCYFIETKSEVNWHEANFACKKRGGDLASIHSKEESDLLEPFVRFTQKRLFIGLYSIWIHDKRVFAWTDGTPIDFTNWREGEPNKKHEECGELYISDMGWNDVKCDEKKGYICSVRKDLATSAGSEREHRFSPNISEFSERAECECTVFVTVSALPNDEEDDSKLKSSHDFIPCDEGWYLFNGKCFRLGARKKTEKLNWEEARDSCKDAGGHLVTIGSKETLDFLVTTFLMDIKHNVWIGLNDRREESKYEWEDGSVVDFTYWNKDEPSGKENEIEDCVEMMVSLGEDSLGRWNDIICSNEFPYICQADINYRKRSPNPQYCSSSEGGGWRFQDSCYQLVTETKTWDSAEQYCQDNFKGNLVTILDVAEDFYLSRILSKLNKWLWVGIKLKEGYQQMWSSGWYVPYYPTAENQNYENETCVLRKNFQQWIKTPCSMKYSFLCETSKHRPPALKTSAVGSHCPDDPNDWRDLGGDFCYFIEVKLETTWYKASYDCKRRGGYLASIHSKEESDILEPFVKYYKVEVFIGLYRQLVNGASDAFVWADGTPMDYTKWESGEPNHMTEECGIIYTYNMEWKDEPCDRKLGYICSVRKDYKLVLIGSSTSQFLVIMLLGVLVVYLYRRERQAKVNVLPDHYAKPLESYTELVLNPEGPYYESVN